MSTPRFPRTRIYRDLARLEAEVAGWKQHYHLSAQDAITPANAAKLHLMAYELERLEELIHECADAAGRIWRLRLQRGRLRPDLT